MEIMERTEAARKGLSKYFTGRPCKKGHTTHRYTASGNCSKCASMRGSNYTKLIKMARFGQDAPFMVELKTMIHRDDLEGLQRHIDAISAARKLSPSPPMAPGTCPHGKPPSEVCQICDIGTGGE